MTVVRRYLFAAFAVVATSGFVAAGPATAAPDEDLCVPGPTLLDRPPRSRGFEARYPKAQADNLGEGWVALEFMITETGAIEGARVSDAVGGLAFVRQARAALARTTYEPPTINGVPVRSAGTIDVVFRMSGENRSGVHNSTSTAYDRARRLRQERNYGASLAVLKEELEKPLNLYEIATLSYAVAVTYMGMDDPRRAFKHIKHATISGGEFADKGVRAASYAMAIELAARENRYREAVCLNRALMQKQPSYEPTSAVRDALARSRQMLTSNEPFKTQGYILESERADIEPRWSRGLLRRSFKVDEIQGGAVALELSCARTHGAPAAVGAWVDVPDANCALRVFGPPGAQFVVEER